MNYICNACTIVGISLCWNMWYVYVKVGSGLNCIRVVDCTLHGMVGLEIETVKQWVHIL